MKILTFIGYYLPGYKSGGPVRTISNLVNLLHTEHEFKIITKNRDQLENKPYQGVKTNEWNKYDKCEIYYSDGEKKLRETINSTDFDIYYLNSFFDYKFSIKVLLLLKLGRIPRKPVLLAPRGDLSREGLSTKWLKKRLYIIIAKSISLHEGIIWHLSSRYESDQVKKVFRSKLKIKVAIDPPNFNYLRSRNNLRRIKEKGLLRILFLSRIAKTKNLSYAIETLKSVKGNFTFDVYGPVTDKKYLNKCKQQIDSYLNGKIKFNESIEHNNIEKLFTNFDLLFLPTKSESYCHIISESLSFGCPVLISDQTPWDRVNEYKAGRSIGLENKQEYIDFIEEMIEIDSDGYMEYVRGCYIYIKDLQDSEIHLKQNLRLFDISLNSKVLSCK